MSEAKKKKMAELRNAIANASTFALEDELPMLPVAELKRAMAVYLEALKPLVSSAQWEQTERITQQFLEDPGQAPALHQTLVERKERMAKEGKSWLEDWWFQYAYLAWPDPLPVNSSVGILLQGIQPGTPPLLQAARVIHTTRLFRDLVRMERVPIETMKRGTVPFTMDQYRRLFSTYRMPGDAGDTLEVFEAADHVAVIANTRLYKLDLLHPVSKKPLCVEDLEAQLVRIHTHSMEGGERAIGIGVLTSEERPTWSRWRRELAKDPHNARSLQVIRDALCVVGLDPARTHMDLDTFYGHALAGNASYRWFDKAFTWIVFADGKVAMNAEHTPSEATLPAKLCEWVLESAAEWGRAGGQLQARYGKVNGVRVDAPLAEVEAQVGVTALPMPAELAFRVSAEVQRALEAADERMRSLWEGLGATVLRYGGCGTSQLKQWRASPDAVAQMAIQRAHYRMYGCLTSTYETGQTRQFRNGRTETVRPASMDALRMCEALGEAIPMQQKGLLVRAALDTTGRYMGLAVSGHAPDRLLLGMKIAALERRASQNIPVPEFFEDPSFKLMTTFKLSTSNVPVERIIHGGFGPVHPDGYGVCYQLFPDVLTFNITWKKASSLTDGFLFRRELERSLSEIAEALESSVPSNL